METIQIDASFKCTNCTFQTLKVFQIQVHLKECYSMPKIGRIFSCAELDELIQESSLTTKTSQMRHLKRQVRRYPCEQCDKSLKSKHGLKKHVNSKHRGIRVNCDYKACQTTFSSSDAKRFHIKSVHQKQKFSCDQCPKQFSTKRCLLDHISHIHH